MSSYKDLSKEDLLRILKGYTEGPHAKIYELGVVKLNKIAAAFMKEEIDVKSEDGDKLFDNFLKFMEKGAKISNELENIQKRIDPEVALRIRQENESAQELSVEWFSKNKDKI